MNDNITEGRWKRIRGGAKEWRGKLTGNILQRTEGKLEKLAGVLQEKYGYTHEKADKKTERRLRAFDQKQIVSALRTKRMNKRQSIGW